VSAAGARETGLSDQRAGRHESCMYAADLPSLVCIHSTQILSAKGRKMECRTGSGVSLQDSLNVHILFIVACSCLFRLRDLEDNRLAMHQERSYPE